MNAPANPVADYLARFAAPLTNLSPTAGLRTRALQQLMQCTSLPTMKDEAWRYVSLRSLLNANLSLPPPLKTATTSEAGWEIHDGHYTLINDERPDNITVGDSSALDDDTLSMLLTGQGSGYPFDTLNLAAINDALVISVAPQTQCQSPVRIRYAFSTSRLVQHSLVVLYLGEGAECTLIEDDLKADGGYLNNRMLIVQKPDSTLQHLRLQCCNLGWQLNNLTVQLAANASYELVQASLGSELRRNDVLVTLQGHNAKAQLKGVYCSTQKQQIDNHFTITHAEPGGESDTQFHGLAAGHSKAIFNGRILIEQGAGQTIANLQNRNLLLSSAAEINTKPELEIYADEVQCAHGATVGRLDSAAIFYFLSRGISLAYAKKLLILGFVNKLLLPLQSDLVWPIWLERLEEGIGSD